MRDSIGHFCLFGDFELDEITVALGLQPSSTTPKGTLYEGAESLSKVADWNLYCPEELTMQEQVNYLLDALWPVKDALLPLTMHYTGDLNVSGEGLEIMELKPELLSKLAHLHVNLNCFFTDRSADAN